MARGVSSWMFFALLAGAGVAFAACADAPGAADPSARALPTVPTSGDGGTPDAPAAPKPPRPTAGPGAHVTDGGVVFRVWAPNATGASVVGDLPGGEVPMKAEGAGFFAVDAQGVRAGARYHFALESASGTLQRIDPYCRERGEDSITCRVVDPLAYVWKTPRFERAKREKQIVYEMHVGSFSVDSARGHGTFASARPKLSELSDLGVNVVELMPVTAFGGGDAGWGYNPQLHFAPKPSYGTADDLRAFIDEAHRLGIAVWLDAVVNHHDSWSQAPLRCFDGTCPNGSAGLYYFGAGPYATTPWGPRPNFADANVRKMLVDSAVAWVDELHGDGFRWDSTSNIRAIDGSGTLPGGKELLVALNAACHDRGATSVAEDLKGYAELTKPAAEGGFGFDAQWDGFGYDVSRVLAEASDDARDLGVIERAVVGGGSPFARLLFTETHDTVGNGGARLPSKVDGADPESFAARRRSMLGAALLFTSPGTPMLFMGQEHLATGTFASTPQPLAAPTPAGTRIRAFYKDLAALRTNAAGAAGALSEPGVQILHRNEAAKVLVYQRTSAGGAGAQDVIVFVNLRNRAYTRYDVGVPAGGTYRVRVTSDRQAYGTDFSEAPATAVTALAQPYDGKPFTLPVALGAYGVVVLTR